MNYCFGIDIGGTTVKMGLFEFSGTIVDKWEIQTHTQNEGVAVIPDVAKSIKEKIKEKGLRSDQILGIGVGVPAPVSEDGVVNGTANLGWKYKEVKRELEELIGVHVKVENDANVAALGEMWKGGGMGHKNLVMVTLGTGVGGGVIGSGRILRGANGAGGEIGHLCVNYNETEHCGCGNQGCLEQYASATGIARLAKKKLAQSNVDSMLRNSEVVDAKVVFDAVKAGDGLAIEIAEEFGRYLGYALANISTITDPAVIVIGGGVSKAGDILFDFIKKPFLEKALFANKKMEFALAILGNDAGICGAAKMILE